MTKFTEGRRDSKPIDLKKRWDLNDYAIVCSINVDEFSEDLRADILKETFVTLSWAQKEAPGDDVLIEIVMSSLGDFDYPPTFEVSLMDLVLQEIEARAIGPALREPYQICRICLPELESLLNKLQYITNKLKQCIIDNKEEVIRT